MRDEEVYDKWWAEINAYWAATSDKGYNGDPVKAKGKMFAGIDPKAFHLDLPLAHIWR